MSKMARIALIGDYHPDVVAHQAIPKALHLSAQRLETNVALEWVHTSTITNPAKQLASFTGFWCVPASPYASMDGALAAIRYGRESSRPFLGTCGGFQHALIEYARNVLGITEADHAETNPDAAMLVISRLSCSLVEKGGDLIPRQNTKLHAIYGDDRFQEMYHCNYGLNPLFAKQFEGDAALRIAAVDEAGEVRAVELRNHPFFIATLFQPERSALRGEAHPLITTFVAAATT